LTVLLIIGLGACTNGQGKKGVTDDTIRVGMIVDLTGPVAFLDQEISAGAKLYLQDVNDQGGVHGRKIELIVEDDGYQPPRTVAAYRKLVDLDGVFCLVGNLGTPNAMAIMHMLERERIPLFSPMSFSSAIYTPARRYVFAMSPSYRSQSWVMVQRIAGSPGAGSARLGVIYQDDDFGLDGLEGLKNAAAYYGLSVIAEESYKRGTMDFSTQILNLKRAGVTHVILWTILRETAAVLKEADQLGWEPQFFGNFTAADDQIVELAGGALKNTLFVSMWDLSRPQMITYLELIKKYTPDRKPGFYHAGGFLTAQGLVEVLQRAGRDLSREKAVEAAETLNGWDKNIFAQPITYNSGSRGGMNAQVFFARADLEQGKMVRATEDIVFELPKP
jgi:branched-chain amino acid transport system substrate-binding protein